MHAGALGFVPGEERGHLLGTELDTKTVLACLPTHPDVGHMIILEALPTPSVGRGYSCSHLNNGQKD